MSPHITEQVQKWNRSVSVVTAWYDVVKVMQNLQAQFQNILIFVNSRMKEFVFKHKPEKKYFFHSFTWMFRTPHIDRCPPSALSLHQASVSLEEIVINMRVGWSVTRGLRQVWSLPGTHTGTRPAGRLRLSLQEEIGWWLEIGVSAGWPGVWFHLYWTEPKEMIDLIDSLNSPFNKIISKGPYIW